MNKLLVKLAITATVGHLLCASPTLAQSTPAPKAKNVTITSPPSLEIAYDDVCIIRWTITNPGGNDDHFGVVHYGTSPESLSQTAQSHIRLNRGHSEAVFRVRMAGLKRGRLITIRSLQWKLIRRATERKAVSASSPPRSLDNVSSLSRNQSDPCAARERRH